MKIAKVNKWMLAWHCWNCVFTIHCENEKIRSIRLRDIGMNKKKSNRIHLGMIHKQIVMLRKKM